MSEEQGLAGHCLMVGLPGPDLLRETEAHLRDLRPAGIILFSRNFASRTQAAELMQALAEACGPRLMAVDQEGGSVDRLRSVFPPFPSPQSVVEAGGEEQLTRFGALAGRVLEAFGFNVNLAPVVDLHLHDGDNALRTRYLGRAPMEVAVRARRYLEGLQSSGVVGCAKHFPGLGRARLDTHLQFAVVEQGAEVLMREDIAPYRYLCPLLHLVMMGHAAYPALAADGADAEGPVLPASCMPAAYRLLRSLRFRGIAITDDLEMAAVRQALAPAAIAPVAFRAGADLLLVGADLDLARHCRDALAQLFGQPFWREEAGWRVAKAEGLPPVPPVDLERVGELEAEFQAWQRGRAGS